VRRGLSSCPIAERSSVLELPQPLLRLLPPPSLKLVPCSRGKRRPLLPSADHLNGYRKPKRHETVCAQWQAAKAAGTTSGTTWSQFPGTARLNGKRSATARIRASNASVCSRALASADAMGFIVSVAAASSSTTGIATSTGSGSMSAQEAQYRCPGSTVVWVNEHSHIYHFPGTRDYGNTKQGAYMCGADAQASGNRAAKNEHHP
jgi:hypothetical protein